MQSIVAGVTEEAAFRGYMQSIIERRYGIVMAILVNGLFFGLLHFGSHPGDVAAHAPVLCGRVGRLWRADVGRGLDSSSRGAALSG